MAMVFGGAKSEPGGSVEGLGRPGNGAIPDRFICDSGGSGSGSPPRAGMGRRRLGGRAAGQSQIRNFLGGRGGDRQLFHHPWVVANSKAE